MRHNGHLARRIARRLRDARRCRVILGTNVTTAERAYLLGAWRAHMRNVRTARRLLDVAR